MTPVCPQTLRGRVVESRGTGMPGKRTPFISSPCRRFARTPPRKWVAEAGTRSDVRYVSPRAVLRVPEGLGFSVPGPG